MKNIESISVEYSQFGKELLEKFLLIPYIRNNTSIGREAVHTLNRLNDRSFRIAVVGEFSSGKSTFLNAVIGKDYLAHGVQETTAALTMITNTTACECGFGQITFSDGTIKSLEGYGQLKEVTTTDSSAYQVSRQIDSVELFVPFMDTEIPVVLVDTPGLNGVAEMHKERTADIIQSAHACIYMLQSRGISETDKKALQWIGQYQQELIIVQNFIDDISKTEGDTLDDILNKQRKLLSESVFPMQEQVNYTVCGISAMKALAAKDVLIKRLYSTDTIDLTDNDRQRLYKESNFEQAMNKINQFMQHAFQRSHLSALYSTYNLLDRTVNILNSQYDVLNTLWETSDDAQIVLRTRQLLESWESRQAENEKKLDNFIVSKINECRRLTLNKLRQLIEEAKEKIPEIFDVVSTPEEWDTFIKGKSVEMQIAYASDVIRRSLGEFLIQSCENAYNLAILRIQEYSGLSDVFSEQSLPKCNIEINAPKLNQFAQEKSSIEREEIELQRLQSQKIADEYRKSQLIEEKLRKENSLIQKRQKQKNIQSSFDSLKSRLGQMPEATSYYADVTDYEYRGGFGILDAFLGPKEITRKEKRYDYSAQERWKEEERVLKNDFTHENTKLKNQLRSLEQEISSTKQQVSELDKTAETDTVRINRLKEIIYEKIEFLKEKRAFASKEYVKIQKEKLKNSVCDYLSDTLQQTLAEIISDEVIRIKDNLGMEVQALYVDLSRSQKDNLQQMLNNNRSDNGIQHESLKQDMNDVLTLKYNLEEYLCKHQVQHF